MRAGELGLSDQEYKDALNLEKLYALIHEARVRCVRCHKEPTYASVDALQFFCTSHAAGRRGCRKIGEDRFSRSDIDRLCKKFRKRGFSSPAVSIRSSKADRHRQPRRGSSRRFKSECRFPDYSDVTCSESDLSCSSSDIVVRKARKSKLRRPLKSVFDDVFAETFDANNRTSGFSAHPPLGNASCDLMSSAAVKSTPGLAPYVLQRQHMAGGQEHSSVSAPFGQGRKHQRFYPHTNNDTGFVPSLQHLNGYSGTQPVPGILGHESWQQAQQCFTPSYPNQYFGTTCVVPNTNAKSYAGPPFARQGFSQRVGNDSGYQPRPFYGSAETFGRAIPDISFPKEAALAVSPPVTSLQHASTTSAQHPGNPFTAFRPYTPFAETAFSLSRPNSSFPVSLPNCNNPYGFNAKASANNPFSNTQDASSMLRSQNSFDLPQPGVTVDQQNRIWCSQSPWNSHVPKHNFGTTQPAEAMSAFNAFPGPNTFGNGNLQVPQKYRMPPKVVPGRYTTDPSCLFPSVPMSQQKEWWEES